jgi:hypothetical protein
MTQETKDTLALYYLVKHLMDSLEHESDKYDKVDM